MSVIRVVISLVSRTHMRANLEPDNEWYGGTYRYHSVRVAVISSDWWSWALLCPFSVVLAFLIYEGGVSMYHFGIDRCYSGV